MIIQCCVCHKIRSEETWLEIVNEAICDKVISHGYCPACFDAALIEVLSFANDANTATLQ